MRVLKDYVVLTCQEGEEKKTTSGILLPSETQEIDESTQEKVVARGDDVSPSIGVGMTVLFKRHMFQQYFVEKKNLLIGKEEGIIAVL
mgnify:FL=1